MRGNKFDSALVRYTKDGVVDNTLVLMEHVFI